MRIVGAVAAALGALLVARPAHAIGLCDPDGHFCVQVDATSAIACDLTRLGGLDPQTCRPEDQPVRERMRAASPQPFAALILRFDGWQVFLVVVRHPALPEIAESDLDAHAREVNAKMDTRQKADVVATPRLSRSHDVQTIRFDRQWSYEAQRLEEIDIEVRASDAAYIVSARGPVGPQLPAFAENVMSTLDAVPARRTNGPGEALTWLLRALLAAGAIAIAVVWLGRRKNRGVGAQDLWPR
jgi:hypothetical protein